MSLKIRAALVSRITQAPALITADRVAYENVKFTAPAQGAWLEFSFMPSGSQPATLGSGGRDQDSGIAQILVCEPAGAGNGASLDFSTKVKARFFAGQVLSYQGQSVTIDHIDAAPSYSTATAYKTPISIYWKAKTTRPTS